MSELQITNQYYEDVTESWKVDHNDAMRARDLEDIVIVGVRFFETLVKRNEQADFISIDDMLHLTEYHIHWNEVTSRVLKNVEILEGKDYIVEKADKLRKLFKQSNAFMPECKKQHEAAKRYFEGKWVSLEEALA